MTQDNIQLMLMLIESFPDIQARWPVKSISFWRFFPDRLPNGRSEYIIHNSIYFFLLFPWVKRLPLIFRGWDVRFILGGFGRIGLAGGDTLIANSFNLFDWIPFFGYNIPIVEEEGGLPTSREVVGCTSISMGVNKFADASVVALRLEDFFLRGWPSNGMGIAGCICPWGDWLSS